MKTKKSLVILICLVLILSLSFASASWFSDFWGKITGNPIAQKTAFQKITCSDSDENNIYTKGIVNLGGDSYTDSCANSRTLTEYICENNLVKAINHTCPFMYECQEGACVRIEVLEESIGRIPLQPIPLENQTCTDTDADTTYPLGNNIYIKGTTCIGNDCKIDTCEPTGRFIEYYCGEDNFIHSTNFTECPYSLSCEDGACVLEEEQGCCVLKNATGNYSEIMSRKECKNASSGAFFVYFYLGIFSEENCNDSLQPEQPESSGCCIWETQITQNYNMSNFAIITEENCNDLFGVFYSEIVNEKECNNNLLQQGCCEWQETDLFSQFDIMTETMCSLKDGFLNFYPQISVEDCSNDFLLQQGCCIWPVEGDIVVGNGYEIMDQGVCKYAFNDSFFNASINTNESCFAWRNNLTSGSQMSPTPCNGCIWENNNKCYSFGYRKNRMYCFDLTKEFTEQVEADLFCENNFECRSNLCINDNCVSQNLWQKFMRFFGKMFGKEK